MIFMALRFPGILNQTPAGIFPHFSPPHAGSTGLKSAEIRAFFVFGGF
jgi:hypothetical protein